MLQYVRCIIMFCCVLGGIAEWGWTEAVSFNDAALEAAVKAQWESATGLTLSDPPEDTELANPLFTALDARELGISDLTGLEACTALTDLNLGLNHISDLAPLSALTGLRRLDLGMGVDFFSGNDIDPGQTNTNLITDISPLATLVNLEFLSLMGNEGLTSIAPVSTMDSLNQLWLASHPIADFSPLTDLSDTLTHLFLTRTGIHNADMAIINGLSLLSGLGFIGEPNLNDISTLTSINPSMFLLGNTMITDVSVVSNFTHLQMLLMGKNSFVSLPDLSGAAGLQTLIANDCELEDISGISGLAALHDLRLDDNNLPDITALASCTGLVNIELSENALTDIQPLLDNPGISGLQSLSIKDNPFFLGTPFCDENQLDQLAVLAPAASIQHSTVCSAPAALTVVLTGTGSTDPEPGIHLYAYGEMVTLHAEPINGSGWAFDHWAGDVSGTQSNMDVLLDGDKTVEAVFVNPGGHLLTVEIAGGTGETTPDPGIYSFLDGRSTRVEINNTPWAYFNGWSGDVTGYLPKVDFTMDSDKTVIANFSSAGRQLSLECQGPGTIYGYGGDEPYYYALGAAFDLTAQPNAEHSRFEYWEGDIPAGADPHNPVLPVVMDRNRRLTAFFVIDVKTLTILIEGDGITSPPGSFAPGTPYIHQNGQTVRVEAISIQDVAFDGWSGDIGASSSSDESLCLLMDQDRTITAHFVAADWNLKMDVDGFGVANPFPGKHGYRNGALANCTARLISGGDAFDEWIGDLMPGADPKALVQVLTMNQNRGVTANFTAGDWTLTLAMAGSPGGSTTPDPGAYAYLNGRIAGIGAATVASAYFAGWTGDVTSDNLQVETVMDRDKTATANYVNSGYVLSVVVDGAGSVLSAGSKDYYLASGLAPVLTAVPRPGYAFDYWSGDLGAGVEPNALELPVLMDQNRTITAHFIMQPVILTVVLEGQGVTHPAGGPAPGLQYTYPLGQHVDVSAELGTEGWAFIGWSGDLDEVAPEWRSFQLTMDQDRTIVANYVTADWNMTLGFTGNGALYPNPGTYGYLDGHEIELTATILKDSDAFDHWEGLPEGVDNYAPNPTFPIHENLSITAIFRPGDYTLTTAKSGGGAAAYMSHPAGTYSYLAGHYAYMDVRPDANTFWGGYSGDINSFDYSYHLLMDGDKNVTITLETSGFELVVNQSGGGLTSPSGRARYVANAVPTIHAMDQGPALFEQWTGELPDGVDSHDRDPEILVDQNRTLVANFVEADWYLYLQVIGNGTTDPAPDLYWHRTGDAFTVTATPGTDTLFLQWQGNVPAGQDPASLTISGTIDQNVELIAVFVPESVTVPDLSGKTQADAEAALAVIGLVLGEVTQEYSDTLPLGQVIAQNPVAATSVAYGSTVSIVVSLGPCVTLVPSLEDITQAAAETALAAAHLALGAITQENSETVPEGHIIRQDPVFGLAVACDSLVEVVISLGSAKHNHSADPDANYLISLSELLRVIQFFNSGGLHCQAGTEDGYAPGLGDTNCTPHTSDYNTQDWLINLSELLRLIQFFNSSGYHYCPDENTEDGFCPGLI